MNYPIISVPSPTTDSAGHHGRWKWLAAVISACALIVPATAKADSILSLDFDGNSGYYNFGYTFAYYGDAGYGYHDLGSYISNENGIFPGIGVGASNALRITADSSAIPAQLPPDRTYEGWASAIVADAGHPTPTSPTLSDYTFSLSARAEGQTGGGDQTAQLDVSIFAPDGNSDLLITLRSANAIALGSAYQDSTMNFGSPSSIVDGSIANFATFYPAANEIRFSTVANDALNAFGYDAGNAIVLDNMNLGVLVVPKPSSPAMAILGGLGLTMLIRRRNGGIPRSSSNSRLEWNRAN